jgi:hypothetical protein
MNLSSTAKSFIGGSFALIAVYLLLAHSGGFAQDVTAGLNGVEGVDKTLQGR